MEHAVIAHLPLLGGAFGSEREQAAIDELAEALADAIEEAGLGEFDGHEFGQGECTLYMYGPDAERLFAVVEPVVKSTTVGSGGYAIKRYGDARDSNARVVRVPL